MEYFNMAKKMTTEDFINKARKIHGDFYDYSKTDYTGNTNKVEIICPLHGSFLQVADYHLQKCGCPKCRYLKSSKSNLGMNTEEFITRSTKVHEGKYDYSRAIYKGRHSKIEIICPIHGSFWQIADDHLRGKGCNKCGILKRSTTKTKQLDQFISDANREHGTKYDYSKAVYRGNKEKIEIICPKHGSFWQKANSHLTGCGCPKCRESKGERHIRLFLEENNIKYTYQKGFLTVEMFRCFLLIFTYLNIIPA